jgi:hypothetical protein
MKKQVPTPILGMLLAAQICMPSWGRREAGIDVVEGCDS